MSQETGNNSLSSSEKDNISNNEKSSNNFDFRPMTRAHKKRLNEDSFEFKYEYLSLKKTRRIAKGITDHDSNKFESVSSSSHADSELFSDPKLSTTDNSPTLQNEISCESPKIDLEDGEILIDNESQSIIQESDASKECSNNSISAFENIKSQKCLVYLSSWQDGTFTVSAKKYKKQKSDSKRYFGHVCRIIKKERVGYIDKDNHSASSRENIKFYSDEIVNLSKIPITIGRGSLVSFTLSSNRKSPSNNRAARVFVDEESKFIDDEQSSSSSCEADRWLRCVVVKILPVNSKLSYFVKSLDQLPADYSKTKDILLYDSNIAQNGLPLEVGDEIKTSLGKKDTSKPFATKCQVVRYCPRSLSSLVQFFDSILDEKIMKGSVCDLLTHSKLWLYLSSIVFKNKEANLYFAMRLMHFLTALFKKSQFSLILFRPIMKQIMTSQFFHYNSDLLQFISSDSLRQKFVIKENSVSCHFDVLTEFFKVVLQVDKLCANRVLPFVFQMGQSEASGKMQSWLMDIMRLSALDDSIEFCKQYWREIDFIPKLSEMTTGPLEESSFLTPVKTKERYASCDEYMDTYYRLLRAESYSAILTGIQEYCAGSLDDRNMNVYEKVHLVGFKMNKCNLLVALGFTPVRHVKRWETTKNLMFGNLLCISPGGTFKTDLIWATVADRDLNLLNESKAILVQFCTEHNQFSDCEILVMLSQTSQTAIMVESPTYFNSLKPVLQSLRRFDMENFPLKREIVECHSVGSPDYLSGKTLFDSTSLSSGDFVLAEDRIYCPLSQSDVSKVLISKSKFLEKLKSGKSTFDHSQINAMEYALTNRLAIIQGPPGCGKTFIGVQLVKIMLSCSPTVEGPILILTYKNHALDEFLKHTLKFVQPHNIVRIGNRSKEPSLEQCNIKSMRFFPVDRSFELQNVKEKIDENTKSIRSCLERMHLTNVVTCKLLLKILSDVQIYNLILHVDSKTFNKWDESHILITKGWMIFEANRFLQIDKLKEICFEKYEKNTYGNDFDFGLSKILRSWAPSDLVSHLMTFHSQNPQSRTTKTQSEDEDILFDEDYIISMNENRMSGYYEEEDNAQGVHKVADKTNCLFRLDNLLSDFEVDESILDIDNPWRLSHQQRLMFILSAISVNHKECGLQVNGLLNELKILNEQKNRIEQKSKIEALKKCKIIGMTIVGASLNFSLIQEVAPKIVIVEEAAEVLEPNLIAALSTDIQHLIMIGDHKQLRPQVDTFILKKNYQFDTSMMERLIESGYPYATLKKQNRMLPEFSALLRDIYPDLEDNHLTIGQNKPLLCLEKSMYFWSHEHTEEGERSYSNEEELLRIEWLVLFLIQSGCEASEITVLAAYLGQTMKLKKIIGQYPESRDVIVNTIDMYQGDENKYVIISLVRSNETEKVGFLAEQNRRCVAQSRAKCGLYFIGNDKLFRKSRHWRTFIASMEDQGCVGDSIGIQCSKHKHLSRHNVKNALELKKFVKDSTAVCVMKCGEKLPCEIESHICNLSCKPSHDHAKCEEIVHFNFKNCGHPSQRKCFEEEKYLTCDVQVNATLPCGHSVEKLCHKKVSQISCETVVTHTFDGCDHVTELKCHRGKPNCCTQRVTVKLPCQHDNIKECWKDSASIVCKQKMKFTRTTCGHEATKECHQKENQVICRSPCDLKMSCSLHPCPNTCGLPHDHCRCSVMVNYKFPCGHTAKSKIMCSGEKPARCCKTVNVILVCEHSAIKECWQDASSIKCERNVLFVYSTCGHKGKRKCHEREDEVPCQQICTSQMSCKLHKCQQKCGVPHCHDNCQQMVNHKFPCGHIKKSIKPCSSEVDLQCDRSVSFKGPCGHTFPKKCSDENPKCSYPCVRRRKCGHTCCKKCGEDCEADQCRFCLRVWEEKIKKSKNKAKERVKKLEAKISAGECDFAINETLPPGEFQKVEDLVMMFIKTEHHWYPKITKIEKVHNLRLESDFEKAKLDMLGDFMDLKFHGTGLDGIEGITKNGFKISDKVGMFGKGIYFATNSSKSAQGIYTKGSDKLLLCNVLLGKTLTLNSADKTLTLEKVREKGFDSVFAPRETKKTGGVLNDEFVIYDPRQAYPQYIITFKTITQSEFLSLHTIPTTEHFKKFTVKHSREFKADDVLQMKYQMVGCHFYEMLSCKGVNPTVYAISEIDVIRNKALEEKFEEKKNEFIQAGIPDKEILAFHGTQIENIDSILKNNFQLSYAKRQAHGKGNYFSEFPDVSLGYGSGLILCQLLLGREYQGSGDYPEGYHSKLVDPDASQQNSSQMVIIRDSDQILPKFVLHLKR